MIKQSTDNLIASLMSQVSSLQREVEQLRTTGSGLETLIGSRSRSEVWNKIQTESPDNMNLPLCDCPELSSPEKRSVEQLVERQYRTEAEMYTPFVDTLSTILNQPRTPDNLGVTVIDTHHNKFLGGVYAPDVAVTIGDLLNVHGALVYMAIELKHTSKTISGSALGQAYDYALAIRAAQGYRRYHIVMVSNLFDSQFVMLDGATLRAGHYIAQTLVQAVGYIKSVILTCKDFHPRVPRYSLVLGPMVARLGATGHSVVSEFHEIIKGRMNRLYPSEGFRTTIAVKRSAMESKIEDITHEIRMLQAIQELKGTDTIVRLAYTSPAMDEFGVMPVGARINPKSLSETMTRTILTDTLSAIHWLHTNNILHRDIRIENVVTYNQRARVIDFGAAVHLPSVPGEPYLGGYLCCPQELIGNFDLPYTPKRSHDLLAFVMMAVLLAFPDSLTGLTSKNVAIPGRESDRLKRFWKELERSFVWGVFVRAAKGKDYDTLSRIGDVFVML